MSMFLTDKRSKWINVKFRIVVSRVPKLQSQLEDFLSLVEWHVLPCPDIQFRSKIKDVGLQHASDQFMQGTYVQCIF